MMLPVFVGIDVAQATLALLPRWSPASKPTLGQA
jgi:hypothetical protein